MLVFGLFLSWQKMLLYLVLVDWTVPRRERLDNYEFGYRWLIGSNVVGVVLLAQVYMWYSVMRDYRYVQAFPLRWRNKMRPPAKVRLASWVCMLSSIDALKLGELNF